MQRFLFCGAAIMAMAVNVATMNADQPRGRSLPVQPKGTTKIVAADSRPQPVQPKGSAKIVAADSRSGASKDQPQPGSDHQRGLHNGSGGNAGANRFDNGQTSLTDGNCTNNGGCNNNRHCNNNGGCNNAGRNCGGGAGAGGTNSGGTGDGTGTSGTGTSGSSTGGTGGGGTGSGGTSGSGQTMDLRGRYGPYVTIDRANAVAAEFRSRGYNANIVYLGTLDYRTYAVDVY